MSHGCICVGMLAVSSISIYRSCWFSLPQVTASVTAGNVNATPVTSVTTVTAPPRRLPAFLTTGRCAADGAAVCVVAVSARSRVHSETPVRNARPALMPAVLRGKLLFLLSL